MVVSCGQWLVFTWERKNRKAVYFTVMQLIYFSSSFEGITFILLLILPYF